MTPRNKYDIPEEIEDLLFPDNHPLAYEINSCIREAYEIGKRRRTDTPNKNLMDFLKQYMPPSDKPLLDSGAMMIQPRDHIRMTADMFTSRLGENLPGNSYEMAAVLWVFGEVLDGSLNAALQYMQRLHLESAALKISPQIMPAGESSGD